MVHLDAARASNAATVKNQALVAVFSGGTSGIGEFTLKALAAHSGHGGSGLRVYLVGRNAKSAEKIFADCRQTCPHGDFRFVEAKDLSLITDVDRCCEAITALENSESQTDRARIDMLFMSHADLHFGPRRETTEGIDKSMSLLYYSRMRFVVKLLPLLCASQFPAHVISVYAGGLENNFKKLHRDDLSLRDPNKYGIAAYRAHVVVMKTFYLEHLAKQHPGQLSLTHYYPGLVDTPAFKDSSHPLWFKIAWAVLGPVMMALLGTSSEVCGERILALSGPQFPARSATGSGGSGEPPAAISTDGIVGGGAYSVTSNGETNLVHSLYEPLRQEGLDAKLVSHTNQVFETIEKGRVFKD